MLMMPLKSFLYGIAAVAILGSVAPYCRAESEPSEVSPPELPPFIPRARWSEDWSVLSLPTSVDDPALPFKHIPIGESDDNYLSLGGEYRFVYERYDPANRGLSDTGKQDVVLHRLAAHADWHINKDWRAFTQVGTAIASHRDGGKKAGDKSRLNLWQLFADYRFIADEDGYLDIRAGRQFVEMGNWLIGSGEARNLRQYYDGIRLAWHDEGFLKFHAFATEFVDAEESSFDMSGKGEYFWGASAGMRMEDPGLELSFLYLGWDLENLQFEQSGVNRYDEERHSLVLWLSKPVTVKDQWNLDYYLTYQFGDYDDDMNSDIKAFAAFGGFKYAFYPRISTPIVGLRTSYFSGDDDPLDDELNTYYNPIFVTPYFSFARDVMPYNLLHLQPSIGYRFSTELQVTLSNDFLWRADKDDAFYTGASAIGVGAGASDRRFIGTQTQLATSWRPIKNIVASLFLVHFEAGDFVEDGGGEDQDYVRLDVSFMF